MYLRTLERCVLKYTNLILKKLLSPFGLACLADFKKIQVKLDLLPNINMLLIAKKGVKRGICHSLYQYAKANSKYMKDYDKNKESSCLPF